MSRKRQIIALGGGGFGWEENSPLDRYILRCSSKKQPRVCFIATASGDNERKILSFYQSFSRHHPQCRLNHLPIFGQKGDMVRVVEESDIFYVGGGSTTNMLVLWRLWGLDKLLHRAYERGKVMAGMSAGANCWFEHYVDDCSGEMRVYPGLGWLSGIFAPHYEERAEPWRATLLKAVRTNGFTGLGCDNDVAIHFVDEKEQDVVAASAKVAAHAVSCARGRTFEKKIKPRLLAR